MNAIVNGRQQPRQKTGLPPHDIAAEEAVIAAMLLDEDAVFAVLPYLKPEDFFREQNRWTFESCVSIASMGDIPTIPTVGHDLDRRGLLDAIGGYQYLAEIVGKYFTAVGVEAHARIVARDAFYRRLIQVAAQLAQMAYEGLSDPQAVVDYHKRSVAGLERRLTPHETGTGIRVEGLFNE